MGCVFYELAAGPNPFNAAQEPSAAELNTARKRLKIIINDDDFHEQDKKHISKYILSMLELDPSSRPSASTLHREFASHCPESNLLKRERTGSLVGHSGKGNRVQTLTVKE
jgi:serine/threonine protein kinase